MQNQNLLYKYCSESGGKSILELMELRLPFASDVNDPFDCSPFFYCSDDYKDFEKRVSGAFQRLGETLKPEIAFDLWRQVESGELKSSLIQKSKEMMDEFNSKTCLISVSKNPNNLMMWAHYTNCHKGVVIEIDFDILLGEKGPGILMHPVLYSYERPRIDILIDPDDKKAWSDQFANVPLVKSIGWSYEHEYRTVFPSDEIEEFQKQGFMFYKTHENGKGNYYFKLNPKAIRSVRCGLYASDELKKFILNLKKQESLSHLKVYSVTLSTSEYKFIMTEL